LAADTPEKTFSAGDIIGLNLLYNPDFNAHTGKWHEKCKDDCDDGDSCTCGSCGAECGYESVRSKGKGHWTCCGVNEKTSCCLSNHTGLWDTSKGYWGCCRDEELRDLRCNQTYSRDKLKARYEAKEINKEILEFKDDGEIK